MPISVSCHLSDEEWPQFHTLITVKRGGMLSHFASCSFTEQPRSRHLLAYLNTLESRGHQALESEPQAREPFNQK